MDRNGDRRDGRWRTARVVTGATGSSRYGLDAHLRPTGVELFATLDDGVGWGPIPPSTETRRARSRVATMPWRHPRGRRLQEVIAWLLGR